MRVNVVKDLVDPLDRTWIDQLLKVRIIEDVAFELFIHCKLTRSQVKCCALGVDDVHHRIRFHKRVVEVKDPELL